MQLSDCSISGHNLVYQLPSDRRGLLVWDGETLKRFRKIASYHEAVLVPHRLHPSSSVPLGPRRCIDVMAPVVPVASSTLHSPILYRSYFHQLASPASKNPAPPGRGCAPSPDCSPLQALEEGSPPPLRNDQLVPPSLALQLIEPPVQHSVYQV